jgi:hypothetical protein
LKRTPVEPITYRDFQAMFRSSMRAWHLELRDSYHVEQEEVPISKWLRDEPDDFAWLAEWLSFVRGVTSDGGHVERLRVVSEPHTTYTRWSLAHTHLNVEAGEDVRYLPRHLAKDIEFPAEDCWLFDDDRLVLSLFKPDGRSGGYARENDAALTLQYRAVRESAWPRAISYAQYVSR